MLEKIKNNVLAFYLTTSEELEIELSKDLSDQEEGV
jgi:hypothetical protein